MIISQLQHNNLQYNLTRIMLILLQPLYENVPTPPLVYSSIAAKFE